MATFEEQLNNLLERTHSIKSPINAAAIGTDINEYNRPSEVWINDVEIFYNNYLKEHPLGDRMKTILFHRNLDAYKNLVGCLESISKDQDFINKMNGWLVYQSIRQKPCLNLMCLFPMLTRTKKI